MTNLYQQAIIRNADWFNSRQTEEGYIDADGDEFYGVRGDATLIGHSVTVRLYANRLTGDARYLESAHHSLDWLARRQDTEGGWKHHAAFTLDGAQCVFEAFNSYRQFTGDRRFDETLVRAADRMVRGTIEEDGRLKLPNIIEIGEYAHFAMLAYKTTGETRFRHASETIAANIMSNFDENEGFWYPFDRNRRAGLGELMIRAILRPVLRAATRAVPLRGRLAARLADHMLPLVAATPHPQYAMSLMDSELLIDTLDGSCEFPELRRQTISAVAWAIEHCRGPFSGTLCESRPTVRREQVYPLAVLNDTTMAATWPTTCLLIAYCGLNDPVLRDRAQQIADWLISVQDREGGFFNFQNPDGTFHRLQSGNVNYYGCLGLWLFGEVYGNGPYVLTRRP